MREILFRGKRKDNGEWITGLLYKKKHNDARRIFISYFPYEDDEHLIEVVMPETIGQFTGLVDCFSFSIFENDIVTITFSSGMKVNGICEFRNSSFGLAWMRGNVDEFTPFTSMCNVKFEIIGNVFDNPELLGVTE